MNKQFNKTIMKTTTKTMFFEEHGNELIVFNSDDKETGDYMLFHPEESNVAETMSNNGHKVFSVFEPLTKESDDDIVSLDTPFFGEEFGKIGYLIIKE